MDMMIEVMPMGDSVSLFPQPGAALQPENQAQNEKGAGAKLGKTLLVFFLRVLMTIGVPVGAAATAALLEQNHTCGDGCGANVRQ